MRTEKRHKLHQALVVLLVLILLTCFSWHVKDAVDKFVSRRTVIATQTEERDALKLPAVTVCPGFKARWYEALEQGRISQTGP